MDFRLAFARKSDHLSKVSKNKTIGEFLFRVLYCALDVLWWWGKGWKISEAEARLRAVAKHFKR
jgi:hypothetical protein